MTWDAPEAWRTNQRINLLLLQKISAAGKKCTLSKRGGRGVAGQFAHIHNVRVWQLQKRAKDLATGLTTLTAEDKLTKATLKKSLTASAKAIERFLADIESGKPKRRGFKKGLATTLAYFTAHESHHRGNILLTLKQSGHKLDKDVTYGIWNWDGI